MIPDRWLFPCFRPVFAACLALLPAAAMAADAPPSYPDPVLWFAKPAAGWKEALPLGNGRLGAMVFGHPGKERIQLNEESLWAGRPVEAWPDDFSRHLDHARSLVFAGKTAEAHAYGLKHLVARPTSFRSYEPLGDLWIEFPGDTQTLSNPAGYRRDLHLAEAVAHTTWKQGKATVAREVFISAPDDVLAIRMTTDQPGTLAFRVGLTRHKDAVTTTRDGGYLDFDGQIIDVAKEDGGFDDNAGGSGPGGAHMRFAGRLKVITGGGTIRADGGSLQVEGADHAVLLFTAATDYRLDLLDIDPAIDPAARATEILGKAAAKNWQALRAAHVADHRALFDRVKLDLGGDPAMDAQPTDARLAAVKKGGEDAGLVALHFHYGRYLLMGSSRSPGRLPANLQGIWSESKWAAWEADYHMNINLQMNYWPARSTNLHETTAPLLDWMELLARRGRESARRLYGSDGWLCYLATNPFGRVTPGGSTTGSQFENSVLDPLCGAWMAAEMFDHYQFTRDRAFLTRLWPILEGACEFTLDALVAAPDGRLVICPSTSPENSYLHPVTRKPIRITYGSTYHMTITRAILDATDRAAAILGVGAPLRARIAATLPKLPPVRLGPDGRILEWVEPFDEAEPGHRHLSHLLGLHPFDFITRDGTPDLFAGANKVIDHRLANGGAHTGWSRAWIINFFARLGNGDAARHHYLELLRHSTWPNLLDVHPPFQIDGNFGATAGLAEMLVQSHQRPPGGTAADEEFILHLLPALPAAWPNGSVSGLTARGGLTVDLTWKDGRVTHSRVLGKTARPIPVRVNGKSTTLTVEKP